jgi:outer membrane protein assembly factor BamB
MKQNFPIAQTLLFSALFLTASFSKAADWPAWRGPDGSGVANEKNLPTKWSDTENVRWKIKLPERGNSTPIVWKDKIFITQPDGERRTVICFDRANGKQFWQAGPTYKEKERSHRTNPTCSASPVTDGERVIAWFGSAGVYCYDLSGKELWHRDLGKQDHEWGYAASPVIHENLCFINFGAGKRSFLIALDKTNGKTIWQVNIPGTQPAERTDGFAGQSDGMIGSWSTPILVKANGRDELIVSFAEWLKAFDPKTGKELWRCGGLNPLIYTSAIYGDGVVVAMGGFHGTSIAVKPGGNGDVTKTHRLWQTTRTKNRLGSGVIHDGHIYIPNTPGVTECLDLRTGKQIWEERLPSKGASSEIWSSAVISGDNNICVLNQSGDCVILKASPTFEVVTVNSIGSELTNGSLAVSDGELFIRTHQHLWCIGTERKTASQ